MTRYPLETIEIVDETLAREEIHRRLQEVGLLVKPKGPPPMSSIETFVPFQAPGPTLSEIVQEERRSR
jgi:hypothetical protein